MKSTATRAFLVLFGALLVVSCSNNAFAPASIFTDQANPTKEILINDGRFDRPYIMLGQVEYTLKGYTSIFVNQIDLRNQAIDFFKKEALAKYGDNVDAIIDTKVQESTEQGYDGTLSVTHLQGVAISFKPDKKTISKQKHRTKRKAKNTFQKTNPQEQEIEITPSEILK